MTPYERYVRTFPEGVKGDLIGGEAIIDMSITKIHEQIQAFLLSVLRLYVREKGLGEVLGSKTTMRVDDENGYEPDVFFLSKDRLDTFGTKDIRGPVDVAVEIVSPSSGKRDRVTKFEGYERVGVSEYWLIDPERREAVFYRLDEGTYKAVPLSGGVFESAAVPGFRLDPQVLFQDPLPSEFEMLQRLLGGEV
ncbi:MAG: Uma2 family endonuclease [Bacteroidota bacterium]